MVVNKRAVVFLSLAMFAMFCLVASPSRAQEETIDLVEKLEKCTSFHWGTDCLVWIVHYPEDIVDPWVSIEAERQRLGEREREAYRQAFVKDLRMEECEPFLLTIYNFGLKSLNLKPLSEHLLLEVDGEKLPLAAYDSNFDEPINGILQGLVFFPKVTSKAFTVILSGVYPREMRFSFDSTTLQAEEVKEKKEAVETSIQPETIVEDSLTMEEIIVELPVSEEIKDAQKELPPNEESDDSLDEPSSFEDATKYPEEPVILPPGPDPLLQVQKNSTKSEIDVSLKEILQKIEKETSMTKEEVVTLFVESWIEGDLNTMYELLASETKRQYTMEEFEKAAMESNIRWAFKDGYDVTWVSDDKAKISGIQKMVLIKVERSKILGLVQERGRWRVVW